MNRDKNASDKRRSALGTSRGSFNWRSPWTLFIFLLPTLFLGWLFVRPLLAPPLTPQELRGKQIYFEGTSPGGGKIKAYVGNDRIALPGSAATCGSCHGPDGRGRPEAGRIPSDITWDHLMKPYGHSHPLGRKHPAFTEASLKRSILNGSDPAGNPLDVTMPTYAMSVDDINDLIAYMKRLQTDFDPGLEDKGIRIATLLPANGQTAAIGQGMAEVMAAYFEDMNSRGGIYNRKLKLIVSPYDISKQSVLSDAKRLMDNEDIFAMVGGGHHRRGPGNGPAGGGQKSSFDRPVHLFFGRPQCAERVHLLPFLRVKRAGPGAGGLCGCGTETDCSPDRGARSG